jgi:hypothetical protein
MQSFFRLRQFLRVRVYMKYCPNCKISKPLTEFGKHKNRYDGLQQYCRPCKNLKSKLFHLADPSKTKIRRVSAKQQIRDEISLFKQSQGCCMCNETNPSCLDFHHVESEKKEHSISDLLHNNSRNKLFLELEKCLIMCANHHRQLHAGYVLAIISD